MNTPGQNSNAVAELAFGMIVSVIRNQYDGSSGFELRGKTLGLSPLLCSGTDALIPLAITAS